MLALIKSVLGRLTTKKKLITCSCYQCGLDMEKPYAAWEWQTGKPSKNYCWLCWNQLPKNIRKPKI